VKVETPNSVGQTMILIPPGEFSMGSTDEQVEAALKAAETISASASTRDRIENAERPQHKVVISQPFWMSSTEVTIGQFKKFSATGYVTEAEQAARQDPKVKSYLSIDGADQPVALITWNDATAYCQWLSSQENKTYRLPTEAEWEYACRAGTTTQYSFGDDHHDLHEYAWHNKNAGSRAHAVGTRLPNPFGLFDMHGNLYEWCLDSWDMDWYEKSSTDDPVARTAGPGRVIRGGHWSYNASYARSAFRDFNVPSHYNNYYGFRCVCVLNVPTMTAKAFTPTPKLISVGGS
jgi:formylglycine-generating enzyme required for sulfatase activity